MEKSFMMHCILVLTCWICCMIIPATCSGNETDRLALISFRNGISLDPFGTFGSWNDSVHFCRWKGVICSKKHPDRVMRLDMRSNDLVGSLSPHIGNLSFLKFITLQNNSFHGQIPDEIGRLFRLRGIDFSNNSFSGELPVNLSHCKNLTFLNLIDNKLTGKIPVELVSLTKLEHLGFSKNHFSIRTIPSFIGNLTTLKEISLMQLGLQGRIPDEISQLRNLNFLQISLNNLSGEIPPGIFNISGIRHFFVSGNKLSGQIPSDIGLTLPNLDILNIADNEFTGKIPSSLSNISALTTISFSQNYFSGPVPKDYGLLPNLEVLEFSSNGLTGDLSFLNSLINCSNLISLELGGNFLQGSLPKSIANLSSTMLGFSLADNRLQNSIPSGIEILINLRFLDLSNNSLTGPIPVGIGQLYKLEDIRLQRNKLTGEIPSSFGNLTALTGLYIGANNLHGSIPQSLGNCRQLLGLDLSQNNLTGSVPLEVISLSSLSILFLLNMNSLSGSLPKEVGFLTNLAALDLSENKFEGNIPNALSRCGSLELLYLQGNSFEGNIPQHLDNLRGLRELDMSRNRLTGRIPNYLTNLRGLSLLNLSFNAFSGEVPRDGIFMNFSVISVTGNNELCGGIAELDLPYCPQPNSMKKRLSRTLRVAIPAVVVSASCLFLLVLFIIFWRRSRTSKGKDLSTPSLKYQFLRVSYGELFEATDGFSEDNMIGLGSYGTVYKGILGQGETTIAVKVLNLHHRGASRSFMSECEALRSTRHRNLLKLVSVCSSVDFQNNDFKALVYEYMANGSLDKWIHPHQAEDGQQAEPRKLKLVERLSIAIDIASAIKYLHNDCQSTIVHGDLKPNNVLLDEDMTARIGDFGLAKIISAVYGETAPYSSNSIAIKGSIGYVAPEYGMTQQVSVQGDVYSYGILLLEMFAGKRPTDASFQSDLNLHVFVARSLPDRVMEIVDPTILSEEDGTDRIKNCMVNIMRIGTSCTKESPRDRMEMGEVICELTAVKRNYGSRRSRNE